MSDIVERLRHLGGPLGVVANKNLSSIERGCSAAYVARSVLEAADTITALRLRVDRLEETLRNVANAYGDQTWGTVTAMERALSEARAVLQQAPTTK